MDGRIRYVGADRIRIMSEEPRHHHYIPQGYLRGFAQKRTSKLWQTYATDLEAQRSYLTNVRNVCGERDFMRVEMDGVEPDKIEKEMSAFETKCIEAIRRVADREEFSGEDSNLTLNLMALLAVRSPEMRENIRGFHEQVAKRVLDITLHNKERWEHQVGQMRGGATSVVSGATYEEAKAFFEGGQYEITVRREYHMSTEFRMMQTVLGELGRRIWTLYIANENDGEFITTNRPVTLSFINPEQVPPLYRNSPGFALKGTEVHFPLTRKAMLVGRWGRGGITEAATQSFIAAVNTHMIALSNGKIFSPHRRFLYADRHTNIFWDENILERIKVWTDEASSVQQADSSKGDR